MKKYLAFSLLALLVFFVSACTPPSSDDENHPGSFTYNGHSYKIVKTASAWFDAKKAALDEGGYLVHISSAAEDAKIYAELVKFISNTEFSKTTAPDGGMAAYVWIGANDIKTEGTWKWTNDKQIFWQGDKTGKAANGQYNNWGTTAQQNEPDNFQNKQDAAAIALTEWPKGSGSLGKKSQWNDVDISNKLFYVIEFDK